MGVKFEDIQKLLEQAKSEGLKISHDEHSVILGIINRLHNDEIIDDVIVL